MNPIVQGLALGYSSQQLIGFLSKAFPALIPRIRQAQSSGHTVEQILGFLSKTMETDHPKSMSQQEVLARNNRNQEMLTKNGLTALAGSAATYALSRAMPNILKGLTQGEQSQTTSNLPNPSPGQPHQPVPIQSEQVQQSTQQSQSQQPPVNQVEPSIPQSTQPVQHEGISKNIGDILEKSASKTKVDELLQSGNSPTGVMAFFSKFYPKEKALIEKESGKSFEEAISDYSKEAKTVKPETKEVKPEGLSKGSTVASPHGIGEVKEVRNGQAIIDVNGKLHKAKEEELVQSPIHEKDLAELYDDLIAGIEKKGGQEVSRNVEWAGYDPKTNELAYKPHQGDKLYVYNDISPEDAKQLTDLLTQRKSSGSNFIGAWKAGTTSPIGAAMYQLIKKLQGERGGKGNEYKNRFDTIYEALELAKAAVKEQHEERKRKAKESRLG